MRVFHMQVRNIGIIDNSYRSNLSNNTAAQTMKEPTKAGSFRQVNDILRVSTPSFAEAIRTREPYS